jgi:hypothetical protein
MGRDATKFTSLEEIKGWDNITDMDGLKKCLGPWMRDIKKWGEVVRDDIIRLEGAVGLATGDTGDPPPAPKSGAK